MLQLYQIERRFNFVDRDMRTLGMNTTKIMKSSFTTRTGEKKPKRGKKMMITMKAGAPQWNHRFNRKHVPVLPTARSRWKPLVRLVNKWPFNPPDKPSFQLQLLPYPSSLECLVQLCTDQGLHSCKEHRSPHFWQWNQQVLYRLPAVFSSAPHEFNANTILDLCFRKKSLMQEAASTWEVHDSPHPNP